MPRLLVALLVVVFGSYFARFVGNAVQGYCRSAGIGDAELLGARRRSTRCIVFVVLLAVDHLDIGGGLIQQTFLILLAGIVLAAGAGLRPGRARARGRLHRALVPAQR